MIQLAQANSIRIPLADKSVHVCVTSPPYFGLRSYSLPPLLWGGREDCRHSWTDASWRNQNASGGWQGGAQGGIANPGQRVSDYKERRILGQFCQLCGCWRGQLGLEPDVGLYVQHLVEIFREVKRVLRRDGQLFLNISDSRTKDRQWYGIPHKLVFALQADGWRWEDEIIWEKVNCMPGSQTNRFTRSHEFVFLLNKSRDAFFDMDAVREAIAPSTIGRTKRGIGRHKNVNGAPGQTPHTMNQPRPYNPERSVSAGRSRRSVWTAKEPLFRLKHDLTPEQRAYVLQRIVGLDCL